MKKYRPREGSIPHFLFRREMLFRMKDGTLRPAGYYWIKTGKLNMFAREDNENDNSHTGHPLRRGLVYAFESGR